MKLNCEKAEALIPRHLTRELGARDETALVHHLHNCAKCQQALEFQKAIESRLGAMPSLPSGLATKARDSVNREPQSGNLSWLDRPQGAITMKKVLISTTAIAALAAGVIVALPKTAAASTPLTKFKDLRTALCKAANRGEIKVEVRVGQNGVAECSGTINGKKLPIEFPLKSTTKVVDGIADVLVTVDFDPSNYQSIDFGKNEDTLKLVYRELPNSVLVVQLDPKSNLPTAWSSEELWEIASPITPTSKSSTPSKHDLNSIMQARIRVRVGQSATVTVSASEIDGQSR